MVYPDADLSSHRELREEWRLEKLDELFLFSVSVVGLLFTIIQVLTIGISGLIEISPILFLGVGLPVYVGYVRGAIEFGNYVTERVRGWVYLVIGITTFIAFFLLQYGTLGILFYSFFLLLALVFGYSLENWFNTYFSTRKNIINLYAFSGTLVAGISLSYFLAYSANLYLTYITTLQFSTLTLALINLAILTLVIFVILEATSRRLVSIRLPISKRQAEKRQARFFLTKLVFCALEIFLMALRQQKRIIYAFLAGLIFYLSSVVALIIQLIYQHPLAQIIYGGLSVASILFLLIAAFLVVRLSKLDTGRFVLWPKEKESIEKEVEETVEGKKVDRLHSISEGVDYRPKDVG